MSLKLRDIPTHTQTRTPPPSLFTPLSPVHLSRILFSLSRYYTKPARMPLSLWRESRKVIVTIDHRPLHSLSLSSSSVIYRFAARGGIFLFSSSLLYILSPSRARARIFADCAALRGSSLAPQNEMTNDVPRATTIAPSFLLRGSPLRSFNLRALYRGSIARSPPPPLRFSLFSSLFSLSFVPRLFALTRSRARAHERSEYWYKVNSQ